MAYLLFGSGVLLVLGSVLYTYRVDRRVKNASPAPISQAIPGEPNVSQTVQAPVGTTPATSYAQVMKRAQVKESITSIGDDLDELIDELREKESEVKDILHRVKGWKAELSVEGQAEVSEGGVAQGQTNRSTIVGTEPEPVLTETEVEKKESTLTDLMANELDIKYTQMIGLLDQGYSAEEVARMLNMGQREVELVQKMRQKGA